MFWTDEQIATLKKLHFDGLSASLIGQEIGVSRGAVLGKLFRLGLCRVNSDRKVPLKKKERKKRARATGFAVMTLGQRAQRLGRLRVWKAFNQESKPSTFCTLMELTMDRCRWSIGEPDSENFGYCGGKREVGSYCAAHVRIAYVPVKKRKK